MSSKPPVIPAVIEVNSVSRHFHMYDRPQDRLKQMIIPRLQKLVGRPKHVYFKAFTALSNVSFEVLEGQTIGIIGRNGSGKSTLLQIICGTMTPCAGSVETCGRVAALLELGAGFNPEFTGRENVFLNGAILGLSQGDIQDRFEEIALFAGIGDYMEQPVKTYSSGMYIRLAFSVATAVDPRILVIDEALAVGDEAFQRKCIQRFEKLRESGTTILLVSHSSQTIVQLCDRALLLDGGEVIMDGHPNTVVANYQQMMDAPQRDVQLVRQAICNADGNVGAVNDAPAPNTEPKTNAGEEPNDTDAVSSAWYDPGFTCKTTASYSPDGAEISNVRIVDDQDNIVNMLHSGNRYTITYDIRFQQSLDDVGFSTLIKSINGIEIAGVASGGQRQTRLKHAKNGQCIRVKFPFECRLKSGTYFINSGAVSRMAGERKVLHRLVDAYMFKVHEKPTTILTGIVDLGLLPRWEVINDEELPSSGDGE